MILLEVLLTKVLEVLGETSEGWWDWRVSMTASYQLRLKEARAGDSYRKPEGGKEEGRMRVGGEHLRKGLPEGICCL